MAPSQMPNRGRKMERTPSRPTYRDQANRRNDWLCELITAQEEQRVLCDSRLPVRSRLAIEESVGAALASPETFGFATPEPRPSCAGIVEVTVSPSDSDWRAYWADRQGVFVELAISQNEHGDAGSLLSSLERAEDFLLSRRAGGAGILWPSKDIKFDLQLASAGYRLDAHLSTAFLGARRAVEPPTGVIFREATIEDATAVARMAATVVSVHIPSCPFARMVPGVQMQQLRRLEESVRRHDYGEGNAFILLAEIDAEVLAIADCMIVDVSEGVEERQLRAGRYGFINSFGVAAAWRGQGVGTDLAFEVQRGFVRLGASQSYLWHNEMNPKAARFWHRLGYEPLWDFYQVRFGKSTA